MTIQITKSGLRTASAEQEIAALRCQFDDRHFLLLPGFFESKLLDLIQRHLLQAYFRLRSHARAGFKDLRMENNALKGLLHFLINDPYVLRLTERLTGCQPLGSFIGAVSRRVFAGWFVEEPAYRSYIKENLLVG